MELTQEIVKTELEYRDGLFFWKTSRSGRKPGVPAGTMSIQRKRRQIVINGKGYSHSRLVFLYHKGYLPKYVDHIDRDTLNDRIENLRECSQSQNNSNRTAAKNKTSKYLGVHLCNVSKKFVSVIRSGGKVKYLGRFENQESAALAYNEAAKIMHGEFANLNIIEQNKN